MKYKLVIFDFDGTLADSFPWFIDVINTVAAVHRFKRIEEHELETLRGYDARQMVRHLGIPWWKLPFVGRHMRKLAATASDHITVFEGTRSVIQRLAQQGVTLAIVTSNAETTVRTVLGPETAALIQHYECSVSTFGKHRRFRKILRKAGVLPTEALAVGDEVRDLEAARKVGIPFGAVSWGYTHITALKAHSPAEKCTRMDGIAEIILERDRVPM